MQNHPLTSKVKSRFGLVCPGLARPKRNSIYEVNGRFCTRRRVTLYNLENNVMGHPVYLLGRSYEFFPSCSSKLSTISENLQCGLDLEYMLNQQYGTGGTAAEAVPVPPLSPIAEVAAAGQSARYCGPFVFTLG